MRLDDKESHLQIHISSDTPIDLQMDTTHSDGRWSAEQLYDYLAEAGFGLVAVTDHDRVETVASIQQLGAQKHVPALAAVEISAEWCGKMGDVLCFGFDPHDQALNETKKLRFLSFLLTESICESFYCLPCI